MPRQGKAPNRRSQAHLVLLCTGGVPLPTGASLRSLVRGNAHAGFWSRGGQSDLSIDCNWSLLRSWLRPHRGISQEKLPLYLGFFEFVHKQNPRNSSRNMLPMKCINRSLLMGHEHASRAVVELMQIRKTPSGPDGVLHHAPEAFDRIEMVPTMGREEVEAKVPVVVGESRIELVRPVEPAPV